ncbi:hypothetical protein J4729_18920, partial [Leisingera sp. HS039]|uniref:hypothetical protein n=1 Tax=Leisingera sp. HS039 TaxID=2818496 RepID=UPI001B3A4186
KGRCCPKRTSYVSLHNMCQTSGKTDPMMTVFKDKLPAPAKHFHPNCQAFLTQAKPFFAANAAKAPSCVLFAQAADVAASCSGRQLRAQTTGCCSMHERSEIEQSCPWPWLRQPKGIFFVRLIFFRAATKERAFEFNVSLLAVQPSAHSWDAIYFFGSSHSQRQGLRQHAHQFEHQ